MHHGGKDSGALTGEAVDGAEDTESTPAGRDRGGMKTVAGAAGDAGAGEGEAPAAAAKAAAVLCCAGAEARVRSQGVERRMARKAVPAPRQPRAGGGGRGRGVVGGAKRHKEIERIGGCGRGGGCPGSPEQRQRRGLGSGRTMRSARRRGIERSDSTSMSGPRGSAALTSGLRRRRRSRSLNRRRSVARADQF